MAARNCSACLQCCNHRGLCNNGTCACQFEFSGQACENPNLSYLVSFACVFFLLFVIATIQLVLCMLFDSRKSGRPGLRNAFRVTTQKILYGIVIGAAGTRGIYFTVQEYIPSQWGDLLLSLYYPALITGFSLLMCHWAESFQNSELMCVTRHQYLNKYSVAFVLFNMFVYSLWVAEVISTLLMKSSLQERQANIFNVVFAFLMLLTLLGFACIGVKLFLQKRSNDKMIVNSKQQKHSVVGLVTQTLLQGLVVILLLYDVFSHLYHNEVTDNVTIRIMIHVLEFGVALWFSCALWNIKKPDALWVLNPELVLHMSPVKEKQPNYGTISARAEDRCFICLDKDPDEDLIFPCKCRGELGVVHPSCLQKFYITLISSKNPSEPLRCRICKHKYKIETPGFWLILSVPSVYRRLIIQALILFVILGISVVIIYFSAVCIPPVAAKFFVICITIVIDLVILQIAGYNWWSYYKKIQAASVRIDGPRAVIQDTSELAQPQPASQEVAVRSYSTNDDNTTITDNEDVALIPSSRSNTDLDNDCNCQLCTESPTIIPEIKPVDSASVLVSVIVHSPQSH
ncbi:uncharacterized protein [Dysidea avara]|uniref:uncharacterized protein n=1 Tax=Dysidea avara TaxID=196820 RepID=UPI00331F7FC2